MSGRVFGWRVEGFLVWRMTALAVAVVVALAGHSAADVQRANVVNPIVPAIVGGWGVNNRTWRQDFRWMVALVHAPSGRQFCGGTLIAPEWVLTAASCLRGLAVPAYGLLPGNVRVLVDTPVLSRGGTLIDVVGFVPFPGYESGHYQAGFRDTGEVNDLALLRLAQPVNLPFIGLATAEQTTAVASPGMVNTAVGWGRRIEYGRPADRLNRVSLPIATRGRCRRAYSWTDISSGMICAGRTAGGTDTCYGDTGGPLATQVNGEWVQVGITSWGNGCDRPGFPRVYTRISSYTWWIEAVLDGNSVCIDRTLPRVIRNAPDFDCYGLTLNDDNSTGPVPIGFPVRLGDTTYTEVYVNNNGNLTFGSDGPRGYDFGELLFQPDPIIAPFLANVDTSGRGSSIAYYGQATIGGRRAFVAHWQNVGYYLGHSDLLNTFQVVLTETDQNSGNFSIEFNYGQIQWESGDFAGDSGGGLGGNSARVGYSLVPGDSDGALEFPGSTVPGSFLDGGPQALINGTNVGVEGRFSWRISNGAVH